MSAVLIGLQHNCKSTTVKNQWEVFPFPTTLIPTPSRSHFEVAVLFLILMGFPVDSQGIPIPVGNPIFTVICNVNFLIEATQL